MDAIQKEVLDRRNPTAEAEAEALRVKTEKEAKEASDLKAAQEAEAADKLAKLQTDLKDAEAGLPPPPTAATT